VNQYIINKEILSAGMGDNPTINSQFENIQMKMDALSQIFDKILKKEKNIVPHMEIKPDGYSLSQNYPNPFNPVTKISITVSTGGYVTLKVYDITGREVNRLSAEYMQCGRYEVEFNGNDLSSGVYYFTMHVGNFRETKRMLLIK